MPSPETSSPKGAGSRTLQRVASGVRRSRLASSATGSLTRAYGEVALGASRFAGTPLAALIPLAPHESAERGQANDGDDNSEQEAPAQRDHDPDDHEDAAVPIPATPPRLPRSTDIRRSSSLGVRSVVAVLWRFISVAAPMASPSPT